MTLLGKIEVLEVKSMAAAQFPVCFVWNVVQRWYSGPLGASRGYSRYFSTVFLFQGGDLLLILSTTGLECHYGDCSEGKTFIILDVGGTRFQVSRASLSLYPDTRLGKLVSTHNVDQILSLCEEFRPGNPEEYFFDRNPGRRWYWYDVSPYCVSVNT